MRRTTATEAERRRTDDFTLGMLRMIKCYEFMRSDVMFRSTGVEGISGPGDFGNDRVDPDVALRVDARMAELMRSALQVGFRLGLFTPEAVSHLVSSLADALADPQEPADDDLIEDGSK